MKVLEDENSDRQDAFNQFKDLIAQAAQVAATPGAAKVAAEKGTANKEETKKADIA